MVEFMTLDEMNKVIKEMGVNIPLKVMTKFNEKYMELLTAGFEKDMYEKCTKFMNPTLWSLLVENYVDKYFEVLDMFSELGVKCPK